MSKFLSLVEEFNPQNTEDPKWKLIEFLRGKGIKIATSDNSDNFQIRTEEGDIMVCVMNQEEEAEGIVAGTGKYEVEKEVQDLASKAASGLKGMVAKRIFGTDPQAAKTAVQERGKMAGQAVNAYKKGTDRIRKGLASVNSNTQRVNY